MRDQLARNRGARAKLRILASYLLAPLIFVAQWLFRLRLTPTIDRARDVLEISLAIECVRRNVPVLGICRGAQLLNVCFGGTLHRDLSSFYAETSNPWTPFPRKRVNLVSESKLRACLGTDICTVNSLHRQAVDRLGTNIRIAAMESTGVVQAIEHPHHRFLIGVQWHPEYLPQRPEQRRLFESLIEAARQRPEGSRAAADLGTAQEFLVELPVPQQDPDRVHHPENR